MTENPATDEEVSSGASERPNRRRNQSRRGVAESLGITSLREAVLWGALVLLALLAAYSLFQFYGFAAAAIDEWVSDGYRELFQAGFNLVVLLVSTAGVALVVRRLSALSD
jgi:hypothetical protein